MLKCLPGLKACNAQVEFIDRRNCGLTVIPGDILRERNLEECLLDGNLISDVPPVFFTRLSRLRRWCMSENALRDVPAEIAHLRELCEVDMSKNFIQYVHPNIRYCALLQRLDLSVNPIGRLPEQLCDLRRLTHLKLNEVELLDLPPRIGDVRNLVVLELRENLLEIVPDSVCGLSRLQSLDLGSNQLRSLPHQIGALSNLVELFVDSNLLSVLPDSIGDLSGLQQLDASNNKLRRLPDSIGQLVALTDLNVAENKLGEFPAAVGCLRRLVTLKAERNRLVTLPPELGACGALREIVLSENRLVELPPTVRGWSIVTNLNIDRNRLRFLPNAICECDRLELLSAAENELSWLPTDIGALTRLHVLNLAGNRLIWLPASLQMLQELKACWLSEQQSVPLISFERQFIEDVGEVLTCPFLPQTAGLGREADPEQADGDTINDAPRDESAAKDESRSLSLSVSLSLGSSARDSTVVGSRKKSLRFVYEPQIVRENRGLNRQTSPHPSQVREQQLLLMRAHALSVRRAQTAANRLLSDNEEPTARSPHQEHPAPAKPKEPPASLPLPPARVEQKPSRRVSRSSTDSNQRSRRISNMSVLQRISKMSVHSNTFDVDSCQLTNWRVDNRQFDQLELSAQAEETEVEPEQEADPDTDTYGPNSPTRRIARSFSLDTALAALEQLSSRIEDVDLVLSLARNRRLSSAPDVRTPINVVRQQTVDSTNTAPPCDADDDVKSEFDDASVRVGDRNNNAAAAADSVTLSSFSTEVDQDQDQDQDLRPKLLPVCKITPDTQSNASTDDQSVRLQPPLARSRHSSKSDTPKPQHSENARHTEAVAQAPSPVSLQVSIAHVAQNREPEPEAEAEVEIEPENEVGGEEEFERHSRMDKKPRSKTSSGWTTPVRSNSQTASLVQSNSLQSLNPNTTASATLSRIADGACEFLAVELHRPPEGGLGISIQGGRNFDPSRRSEGVYVYVVQANSAGERAGLRVGDKLLSVNGTPTANLTHQQTASLLKAAGPVILLMIARARTTPMPFGDAPIASATDSFLRQSNTKQTPVAVAPRSQSQSRVATARPDTRTNGRSVSRDDTEADEVEGELVTGSIRRDEQGGLGMSVITGDERLAHHFGLVSGAVYVSKIAKHGPMERCGKFRLGDRLISINQVDVTRLSREQTFSLLTGLEPVVRLTVYRSRKPFPLAALEPQIVPAGRATDGRFRTLPSFAAPASNANGQSNAAVCSPSSAFKPIPSAQSSLSHSSSQQQLAAAEPSRRSASSQQRSLSQFEMKSPMETLVIYKAPNAPIGMSIIGGSDKTCQPFGPPYSGVYISRVARDSPASAASLRIGDRLVAVGDVLLHAVTHDEAKALLRSLHPVSIVRLTVERRPAPAGLRELTILKRGAAERLGMSIKGGVGERCVNPNDTTDEGIFVWRVHPDGAVQRDGRLAVGLRLLEVNDETLIGVRHADAVRILKAAANPIRLVVCDGIEPSVLLDQSDDEAESQAQAQAQTQPQIMSQSQTQHAQLTHSPSSMSSVSAEVANYSLANGDPSQPPRLPPKMYTQKGNPKSTGSNGSADHSSLSSGVASGPMPVAVLPHGFQLTGQIPHNAVVAIPGSSGMQWQPMVVLMPLGAQAQQAVATDVQKPADEEHSGYQPTTVHRSERVNGSNIAPRAASSSVSSLPQAEPESNSAGNSMNQGAPRKERHSSVSSSSSAMKRRNPHVVTEAVVHNEASTSQKSPGLPRRTADEALEFAMQQQASRTSASTSGYTTRPRTTSLSNSRAAPSTSDRFPSVNDGFLNSQMPARAAQVGLMDDPFGDPMGPSSSAATTNRPYSSKRCGEQSNGGRMEADYGR